MITLYVIWLLSLFVLPFLQGGYFYYEAFFFGLIQLILLLISLVLEKNMSCRQEATVDGIKKKYRVSDKLKRPFNYIIVIFTGLLVLAYMSSFWAIDLGYHFFGVLKLTVPLIWLLNLSFFSLTFNRVKDHLIMVMTGSALTMSLLGMVLVAIGHVDGTSLAYLIQKGRYGGFFQYANTYASYVFGVLILVMTRSWDTRLKGLIGIVLSCNIFMTQSRGSIIVYGTAIVIALIYYNLSNIKGALITLKLTYSAIIISVTLLTYAFSRLLLSQLVSVIDLNRSFSTGGNTSEWLSRLVYYIDGFSMIKEHPLGLGYSGYDAIQGLYQTGAAYKVKYIHSSLLQFTIDYGVLAGVMILLMLAIPLILTIKNKSWPGFREALAYLAFYGMFGHSLIDFDFQFTAYLILWLFLGYIVYESLNIHVCPVGLGKIRIGRVGFLKLKALWYLIPCLLILVFAFMGRISYLEYNGQTDQAYISYPYYTPAISKLLHDSKSRFSSLEKEEIAKKAVESKYYYVSGFAFLRDYYYNNGDLEEAVAYAKKVYQLAPLRIDYYDTYIRLGWRLVLTKYNNSQLYSEDKVLKDLTNIANYMKALESDRKNNYTIKHQVDFKLSEEMLTIKHDADYLRNKIMETDYEN